MPNSRASDTERDAQERQSGTSPAPRDASGQHPEGAAAAAPESDLSVELAQAEDQLAQAEDRYKRALADLENYRKRSARDLQRRIDESTDALIRDWLDALDSVERALRMQPRDQFLFEGLRAVLSQMEAILERQGVQRTGTAGERFDPERHEAVGVRQTTDLPDRTVVEVARSGFARGDRVLRPAQVIVSDAREPNV
jgi:molecular chaperone GrpE